MRKELCFIVLFIVLLFDCFAQQKIFPQLGKDSIRNVINAMTLDEKINLLVGIGDISSKSSKERNTVLIPNAAGQTWNCDRYGIPSIVLIDGPAGVRIGWLADQNASPNYKYTSTAFPTGTALAAAWNTDLAEFIGETIGQEVLDFGCDVLLSPGVNIQRDLLCGRNFEYYSEDPFLVGKMGAGMVRGIQSKKVGACVKHFAANNAETNRNTCNSVVSQRALREIYLKPFEMVVKEANPWSIMTSYNRLNGYYTSENPDLIETILRKEWGFKGLVMTDWGAGNDPIAQMRAGNDLIMPGEWEKNVLRSAVKNNILNEEILNRNLVRVLEYIMKCPHFRKSHYSGSTDLRKHAEISKKAARETMVLLKNENNTLPIGKSVRNVALFGKTSYKYIACGIGAGDVNYKKAVNMPEALTVAGYNVNATIASIYQEFVDTIQSKNINDKWIVDKHAEMPVSRKLIESQVDNSDMAIVTLGRITGECFDRSPEDFVLSDIERKLLFDVTEVFHKAGKKVIVVMNMGGMIQMSDWNNLPDAILHSFLSGQESASAVVDILCGIVNPSGKLPMTLPVKYTDSPSSRDCPGVLKDNPIDNYYNDDIYVGYRYYDTFETPVTYEFGYGLSYTTFKYSNLQLSKKSLESNDIVVKAIITNTGKVPGKEVVQMYISAPKGVLDRPVHELKGFIKTRELQPGESQSIEFRINKKDLSSFWTSKSAWIVDRGEYIIQIGASSRDIRLSDKIIVGDDIKVETVHDVLYPNKRLETLVLKK